MRGAARLPAERSRPEPATVRACVGLPMPTHGPARPRRFTHPSIPAPVRSARSRSHWTCLFRVPSQTVSHRRIVRRATGRVLCQPFAARLFYPGTGVVARQWFKKLLSLDTPLLRRAFAMGDGISTGDATRRAGEGRSKLRSALRPAPHPTFGHPLPMGEGLQAPSPGIEVVPG